MVKENIYINGMLTAIEESMKSPDGYMNVGSAIMNSEGDIICSGYNDLSGDTKGDPTMIKKGLYIKDLLASITHAEKASLENLRYRNPEGNIDYSKVDAFVDKINPKTEELDETITTPNDEYMSKCTIYVTYFPCSDCAKLIEASGIKNIVYLYQHPAKDHQEEDERTIEFLRNSNVSISQFPQELIEDMISQLTDGITFKGYVYTGQDEIRYLLSCLYNHQMPNPESIPESLS